MNAKDAADAAGVTYRRMDHWLAKGWLGARHRGRSVGSGNERDVTPEEVERARLMGELTEGFGCDVGTASVIAERVQQAPQTLITYKGWVLRRLPDNKEGK